MAKLSTNVYADIDHAKLNRRVHEIKQLVTDKPHLFFGEQGAEAIRALCHAAIDDSITVRVVQD